MSSSKEASVLADFHFFEARMKTVHSWQPLVSILFLRALSFHRKIHQAYSQAVYSISLSSIPSISFRLSSSIALHIRTHSTHTRLLLLHAFQHHRPWQELASVGKITVSYRLHPEAFMRLTALLAVGARCCWCWQTLAQEPESVAGRSDRKAWWLEGC